ncbi:hypothetical protein E6C60_2981 [Paenibacillus algicola]|uniref:Uncharacterized protein n=1 Tax=Paenibacillus algicola TaxID=2565926 RepID=A0A4P8XLP7_9BACL|nr:hypothetical protein E6C60_2981 [Paenibacillus algicola]
MRTQRARLFALVWRQGDLRLHRVWFFAFVLRQNSIRPHRVQFFTFVRRASTPLNKGSTAESLYSLMFHPPY